MALRTRGGVGQGYLYDAFGNLTHLDQTETTGFVTSRSYATAKAINRLTEGGTGTTCDASGNLRGDARRSPGLPKPWLVGRGRTGG